MPNIFFLDQESRTKNKSKLLSFRLRENQLGKSCACPHTFHQSHSILPTFDDRQKFKTIVHYKKCRFPFQFFFFVITDKLPVTPIILRDLFLHPAESRQKQNLHSISHQFPPNSQSCCKLLWTFSMRDPSMQMETQCMFSFQDLPIHSLY